MSLYYNLDKLYSRDFLIGFVIGERGVGKSFSAKLAMLKRFIRTGEQFIYVRRYKTELDTALATFWDDLQTNGYFDDLNLQVKKSKMLTTFTCDGEVCGYAVPLSTANILKSTSFPKVTTIIFDEFLLPPGNYRYLKNETNCLLDVIETVFRLRSGKTILLGNNIAPHSSPYFAYWNLELPQNGEEFRSFRDGTIVIQYVRNMEYRQAKKNSRFYKLIEGSDFAKYAVDNEALNENLSFIEKKPPKCRFYGLLIINGTPLGIWSASNGCLYLSEKHDPNTTMKFVFDYSDHTEGTIFEDIRHNLYMHLVLKAYKQGWLRFDNQKVKAIATSLLNKCIAI